MKKRINFDYAAGAPMRESVVRHMARIQKELWGNPGSIHTEGVQAKAVLDESRAKIACLLDVAPGTITFTGSGTESIAIALLGCINREQGSIDNPHIVSTTIEHPAVIENLRVLEKTGVEVTYISPDNGGIISSKQLREALKPNTFLVSIGYVNSELGTVQPIREYAKEIRHFKKETGNKYPYFHTDASQASSIFPIRVPALGVDMLSMNSAKVGGPRNIGLLYVARDITLSPLFYGGGQENGLRSGTEDVISISGFTEAFQEARNKSDAEYIRLKKLQEYFITELTKKFPHIRINGSLADRTPANVHISCEGFDSELLVIEFDARGIAVSAGSACRGSKGDSSYVLESIYGKDDAKKWGSVRFSMGYRTQKKDIDSALSALKSILKKYNREL